jgi:hypothetical protein
MVRKFDPIGETQVNPFHQKVNGIVFQQGLMVKFFDLYIFNKRSYNPSFGSQMTKSKMAANIRRFYNKGWPSPILSLNPKKSPAQG